MRAKEEMGQQEKETRSRENSLMGTGKGKNLQEDVGIKECFPLFACFLSQQRLQAITQ